MNRICIKGIRKIYQCTRRQLLMNIVLIGVCTIIVRNLRVFEGRHGVSLRYVNGSVTLSVWRYSNNHTHLNIIRSENVHTSKLNTNNSNNYLQKENKVLSIGERHLKKSDNTLLTTVHGSRGLWNNTMKTKNLKFIIDRKLLLDKYTDTSKSAQKPKLWAHRLLAKHNNKATEPNWNKSNLTNGDSPKLLTIFTTFKKDLLRENIQSHTIYNWAEYKDDIQPVLFSTFKSGILIDRARQNGWLVEDVPNTNDQGTPYWKDMYFRAYELSRSLFYAYCNGDILFNEGLVKTLKVVAERLDENGSTLVIGIRTNVHINETDPTPFYTSKDISQYANKHGIRYRADAEDYFIIGHPEMFPWHIIKDIVIGRPGYDNYIVGLANKSKKITVIDASSSVLAVHLSGSKSLGRRFDGRRNIDGRYNLRVIGKFPYGSGLTIGASFCTSVVHGKIKIVRR